MKIFNKSIAILLMYIYLPTTSSQNVKDNEIMSNDIYETEDNKINKGGNKEDNNIKDSYSFDDIASSTKSFFESDATRDIVSNLIDANKETIMQNLLVNAMQNPDATGEILAGISSVLTNKKAGAAIDPNLMGQVLSSFMSGQGKDKENAADLLGSILSTVSQTFKDSGENPTTLLMSSLSSFFGPEADYREQQHAAHAQLLPPLLEKAHLYFDHFKHTELYRAIWRISGLEKLFQSFNVDGKFNYDKFFDRLENKNFRKHWIHVITQRITKVLAFVTDSSKYQKYLNTAISLFNGFLKSVDFPKSVLFDITRPKETLVNLANYFLRVYLNLDMDSTPYVGPAVTYVEDVLRLAHNKGFLHKEGLDSDELAQKLTDTLNLEIIEPILRVWRAFRFAKKVPECDKYVMCLINQDVPETKISLPGLKMTLSKTASMFAAWFLSERTGTSFWTLYSTIIDEKDCSIRFLEKCNDFHIEEVKVESEYVHTEL